MSKTPNFDSKIKAIFDATEPGERVCALTGEKWIMTEEEIGWYKLFQVPPMKICSNTHRKWMAYFDVGYQFWWNKHFDTGKPVLSFHHPASGVRVLPDKEWYEKDFSDVAADIQVNQPFFSQLQALQLRVPLPATANDVMPENSISLFSFGDRDSYFLDTHVARRLPPLRQ